MRNRVQHYRGGHGSHGITLAELESMIVELKRLGYNPDKTRVCSARQRDKGLVDIFFMEGEDA